MTWTVIRGLQQRGELGRLLADEFRPLTGTIPSVLLWGAPAGGPGAERLANELAAVSTSLGEHPRSRTEPDVVLAWPGLLAIVEAKLGSKNESKPSDYRGWPLYAKSDFFSASPAEVAATGLYELARNWRLGCQLAGERAFALINLGRDALDRDTDLLRPLLATSDSRMLMARRWAATIPPEPAWLRTYAAQRSLLS